jgi:CheY-like chemotaxis protein
MDIQMPVMDGLEATRRLRAQSAQGKGRHLPIIAMTANASTQDRRACLAAGMNDFVTKPVEPKRLLDIVARWVDRSAATPEPASPAPAPITEPATGPAGGQTSAPALDAAPSPAPAASRPAQPSGEAVLDPRLLQTFTLGSANTLVPIVKVFESMMDKTLIEMREALAAHDALRLGQLGHKARSSALAVGSEALAQHCHALEAAMQVPQPDFTRAAELVQHMERLSPLVVQALQAHLAQAALPT